MPGNQNRKKPHTIRFEANITKGALATTTMVVKSVAKNEFASFSI